MKNLTDIANEFLVGRIDELKEEYLKTLDNPDPSDEEWLSSHDAEIYEVAEAEISDFINWIKTRNSE